jgi:hypothetical protein
LATDKVAPETGTALAVPSSRFERLTQTKASGFAGGYLPVTMGHLIFLILHVVALLFLAWALVVTIPLHLIYGAMMSRSKSPPDDELLARGIMRRCPQCAELIKREAVKCKHCGAELSALQPLTFWQKHFLDARKIK